MLEIRRKLAKSKGGGKKSKAERETKAVDKEKGCFVKYRSRRRQGEKSAALPESSLFFGKLFGTGQRNGA